MATVNYATQYAQALANAYPYLSYYPELWAGENATKYRPVMGKTVAVPSLTVSGAAAVNRDSIDGSFARNWDNAWQTLTMSMDREWSTLIDPMDIVQTNDVATIANITETFNQFQKVPEMDAYATQELYKAAYAASHVDSTSLNSSNILAQWDTYLAAMTEARVPRDRIVAKVTPAVYKLLKEATGITRFIDAGTGIRNIDRNVGKLDGVTIMEVPSDMMQGSYTFTSGWEPNDVTQVNILMYDPLATVAPIVYDTSMISAPSAGTKGKYIYYERYYYDVFALNQRTAGIYCNATPIVTA